MKECRVKGSPTVARKIPYIDGITPEKNRFFYVDRFLVGFALCTCAKGDTYPEQIRALGFSPNERLTELTEDTLRVDPMKQTDHHRSAVAGLMRYLPFLSLTPSYL